ncbi:MAG: carbohydrate ABC transporter permease [Clostridia bacterium]|nr:carbohydrate ABC transporter permease [Clostridia bacterium]MBR4443100.1 carbohydrate ABC transporter permease [Clostridia bacterium]
MAKKNDSLANNLISKRANLILNIILLVGCFLTIMPLWLIVSASLTDNSALTQYGYRMWPMKFSTLAYTYLFQSGSIIVTAYKNTIIATVVGTVLATVTVGLYAYALSRPDFKYRRFFTFFSFFTMLFGGGMVSYYAMMRMVLGLKDTVWALFLPMSFSAYWVIIMRTFYTSNVPESLIESARIDGSGEWRTLVQIVTPLAIPGFATVALFSAIGIWNDFRQCLLLNDSSYYYNLQYTIYQTMNNLQFMKENASKMGGANVSNLPTESFRMAMAVVTVGPIILAYPFFQQYFIKGLTVGAVKG